MAPTIARLDVVDSAAAWRDCGFAVGADGTCQVGTVAIALVAGGELPAKTGLRSWALSGAGGIDSLDGIPTSPAVPVDTEPPSHPNGVTSIDHVVVLTPDLDRTVAACEQVGLRLRATRESGTYGAPMKQAFFRMAEVILEVVGPPEPDPEHAARRARFFGIAFTCADLDTTKAYLGDRMGEPKPAVQPGRRITSVKEAAGLRVPVALMSPEPA